MAKVLYEDKNHQEATRVELDWCLESVQDLLDEYNKLKISKADSIHMLYGLLSETEQTVQLEMAKKAKIAKGGNMDLKPGISTPIALGGLIRAAAACKRFPFVERSLGLFDIEGGKVVMNEQIAERLIHNRSIIAQSEQQIEVADKIQEFTDLFNELDYLLKGRFLLSKEDRQLWGKFFDVTLHGQSSARMNPEKLRTYLQNV